MMRFREVLNESQYLGRKTPKEIAEHFTKKNGKDALKELQQYRKNMQKYRPQEPTTNVDAAIRALGGAGTASDVQSFDKKPEPKPGQIFNPDKNKIENRLVKDAKTGHWRKMTPEEAEKTAALDREEAEKLDKLSKMSPEDVLKYNLGIKDEKPAEPTPAQKKWVSDTVKEAFKKEFMFSIDHRISEKKDGTFKVTTKDVYIGSSDVKKVLSEVRDRMINRVNKALGETGIKPEFGDAEVGEIRYRSEKGRLIDNTAKADVHISFTPKMKTGAVAGETDLSKIRRVTSKPSKLRGETTDYFVGDKKIAYISKIRDYVKAKEADRLRTVMATRWNLGFETTGLRSVFDDQDVSVRSSHSYYYNDKLGGDKTIYNIFDSSMNLGKNAVISELNDFAKKIKSDLRFE